MSSDNPLNGPGHYALTTIMAGTRHANPLPTPPEGRKLERIWTVIDREKLTEFGPVHNVSAFLEDHIHDWRIDRDGQLHYYSRVAEIDQPVEVVFDFETTPEMRARFQRVARTARPRPR